VGTQDANTGSATVTHTDDIIICRLFGHITGTVVRGSMRRTKEAAEAIRAEGKAPKLLLDIGRVSGQTSEARREAKRLTTFGLERVAVAGGGRPIVIVGKYIARAAGMGDYTHFFRMERSALAWLNHRGGLRKPDDNKGFLRLGIALLVLLICSGVLAGWATDNQALKAWLPDANSMNPTNAVNFILITVIVLLIRKKRMGPVRKGIITVGALWFIIYGGVVVVRNAFGWDIPVDRQLFASKITFSNGVAPNTSLDYLLFGGMMLCIVSGLHQMWQRYVFHIFSVLLVVTTLGAVLGMSFGLEQLYSGNFIPMALNTAIVFLLLNHILQTVTIPLPFFARIMNGLDKYWQPILVLSAMVFVVGLAWQQSLRESARTHEAVVKEEFTRTQDAIVDRFGTYTNVLRGYKGFFESSDSVNVSEYRSYFASSQPAGGYPGFTAISFIRYIPRSQESAFVTEMRSQAGAVPELGNYTITPKTNNQTLYPLAYIQPSTSAGSWGFDLGTNEARLLALETARDSGQPTASGEIDLNASRADPNAPKRTGFLMTIPVYKNGNGAQQPETVEVRRSQIYGFINTVFENEVIFKDIFGKQTSKEVKFIVSNTKDRSELYTYNAGAKGLEVSPTWENQIYVGGQQWNIAMYTPADFGITGLTRLLPYLILLGGSVLSLLAFAFLMGQMRQRDQALRLADDMTEDLKRERNEAVVAQQKDEAILASIGDAVFAIDPKGRILLFNPAAEALSGYAAEEAIGKHHTEILQFIAEKDRKASKTFVKSALAGHTSKMPSHTKLIRKDGTELFVSDSAAPIRNRNNEVVGAIVVFRDVSKELVLEHAKSEFVSLASHQLRTPLSAINWYAEMLLNGDAGKINKEQHEYMREIYEGNQRMVELVDSLLNVSRLEVGKLKNEPQHTSMLDLAASLEKEMQTSIVSKKMAFKKELDANVPTLYADPKLLRMIVQNLLSNAIKYTPAEGTVTLVMREATAAEVSAAKLRSGQPYFFMSVSDTGYGIPKEQQPKIFEKLFRADNVRKLDVEGTGLGLYIIKEVSKKLGGAIWFESKESAGTTFYVVLPFKTDPS